MFEVGIDPQDVLHDLMFFIPDANPSKERKNSKAEEKSHIQEAKNQENNKSVTKKFEAKTELEKLIVSSPSFSDSEKSYALRLLALESPSKLGAKNDKQAWKNLQEVKEYFDVAGDSECAVTDIKFYIEGRVDKIDGLTLSARQGDIHQSSDKKSSHPSDGVAPIKIPFNLD